jgi:lipoprotein-anchoring transpeptidase ErfK/SrfK
MNEDDFERTLREAFDGRAREAVGDSAAPPPPRFVTGGATVRRHRRARLLAPVAAAAAVVGVVTTVAALRSGTSGDSHTVGVGVQRTSAASSAELSRSATAPATPAQAVHIRLLNTDGATYGVGMPVIAFFSKNITSGRALSEATTASVNGKPLPGAWYFETSNYYKGYPLEAHWRPESYWPAHAKVHVAIAAQGLPAGPDLAFDDALTLDFATGARTIAEVDDTTHRMTVDTDGKLLGEFPVSLGASRTPTSHGVKVIMEKGRSICMSGPGYSECGVKYTQRLTYSGEYLHSAPWNVGNIKRGIDSSNGCTNLLPDEAKRLYGILEVGDVVGYPNAPGPAMRMGDGYGDWNVPWAVWRRGGAVPVT